MRKAVKKTKAGKPAKAKQAERLTWEQRADRSGDRMQRLDLTFTELFALCVWTNEVSKDEPKDHAVRGLLRRLTAAYCLLGGEPRDIEDAGKEEQPAKKSA